MNNIWLGDCLELMQNIPAKSVDMILCDLPYGTTACKWDTIIPFEPLWQQYKRIIKDNGAIVLFGTEPFSSYLRMSNISSYKYDWIWNKVSGANFMQMKTQPIKVHEIVHVFCNGTIQTYNPQYIKRTEKSLKRYPSSITPITINCPSGNIAEHYGIEKISSQLMAGGVKNPISILEFNRVPKTDRFKSKYKHPTQKPVALFEYLIKTYTNEGETVLDNCAGSGTTAIACLNTNRNYICIEKEPKYYEIILNRIAAHLKEQNTKLF